MSPIPLSSPSRQARLAELRDEVRRIESPQGCDGRRVLPFGLEAVDDRLTAGGLAVAGLHEVAPASSALGDDAASTLFIAAIAARLAGSDRMILWALSRRDLFAPGLAQAGLGPDRLIHAECRQEAEILAVMEEGLRHGGLAAVVGEVTGALRLPAARRLQLAAEEGGTMALLLRRARRGHSDPFAAPSAALSRWQIGCLPSERQPVPAVGRGRWQVTLVRQRGGAPAQWTLEAPDAEARLALPALSGDRPDQAGGTHRRAA